MKTLILTLLILIVASCGSMEKIYDEENYESLTNETGNISILSGGKIMFQYQDAKILYSSSDTQALWFIVDGKKYYHQGDVLITIDD